MRYSKIADSLISELKKISGEHNVLTDHDRLTDYSHDEFAQQDIWHYPEAVVKPGTAEQVSAAIRLCAEANVPVTVRGSATGLCGGCIPVFGGLVMSLENMNKIIEIDPNNMIARVEAGMTLQDFYKAIEKTGLFFPPHPGDESATIGGVIATNAGGSRAIKYGVIRNFIKGLEVVLADGTITTIGGKFIKNSSGLSLLHLLIGSEGTLGVITGAVISLMPPPVSMVTLVAPYDDLHDAIGTIPAILRSGIIPMAAEFIEDPEVRLSESHTRLQWPIPHHPAYLVFIVDGSSEEEALTLAEKISGICMDHKAADVFIADSRQKQETILAIRSRMYDALKPFMAENLDIVVPRAGIADFADDVRKMETELDLWIPTYGHAADGNIHNHLMRSAWKDGTWTEIPGWEKKNNTARDRIHELCKKYGGMVSGEHGIGLVKKGYLSSFIGPDQVKLMKGIKAVFDPKNILNPGKMFD